MSSQCTDERFKLDERFEEKDEDQVETLKEDEAELEKEKNFEILEKVLGFQVPKSHTSGVDKAKKRKYVRFDPESDNAVDYIRKQVNKTKEEKKRMEDGIDEEKTDISNKDPPVVSSERFFEVATNLKDLLGNSDQQFSLGKQFKLFEGSSEEQNEVVDSPIDSNLFKTNDETFTQENNKINNVFASSNQVRTRKRFFIQPEDDRLKEGVNFFHWTKPLDPIREKWPAIRNTLIEAYKKNRKTKFGAPKQKSKNFHKPKQFYK